MKKNNYHQTFETNSDRVTHMSSSRKENVTLLLSYTQRQFVNPKKTLKAEDNTLMGTILTYVLVVIIEIWKISQI